MRNAQPPKNQITVSFQDKFCLSAVLKFIAFLLASLVTAEWEPEFTGYDGTLKVKVNEYKYMIGRPDCGKMQMWPVYHDPTVSSV